MPNPSHAAVDGEQAQTQAPLRSFSDLKRASRWLTDYASNVTSQKGEDGIVAKALSMLPAQDRWCVEFGAWDGQNASNTFALVDGQNYRAVLIEGSQARYRELAANYPHQDRAIFVNAFVGWSSNGGLDEILGRHAVPRDFDFLSIDIDGNDYYVWQAVREFRPKLVLIEYNFTIANAVDFVQPADSGCQQGSSAAALARLGKEKGYELIAVTDYNLLFVDRTYYPLFSIPDNSVAVMRDEPPNYVFFGYDGTVFLNGRCALEWHPGLRLEASKIQILPAMLRHYPDNYTSAQRWVYRLFSFSQKPKESMKHIWRRVRRQK